MIVYYCVFLIARKLWNIIAMATDLFTTTSTTCKMRCQVFMSQEIRFSQNIIFSIAVLFYPYKEEPEPVPHNYKYILLDSGLLEFQVSNNDAIQFEIELNEQLLPRKHIPISGLFGVFDRYQQKSITVELDGQVELQGGFPIGELTLGVREQDYHTLTLIMVSNHCYFNHNT